jgi:hypothetical protein
MYVLARQVLGLEDEAEEERRAYDFEYMYATML